MSGRILANMTTLANPNRINWTQLNNLFTPSNISSLTGDAASNIMTTIVTRTDFRRFTRSHLSGMFGRLQPSNFTSIADNVTDDQLRQILDVMPTNQMNRIFDANMVSNLTPNQASICLDTFLRRTDINSIPTNALNRLAGRIDDVEVGTMLRQLDDVQLQNFLSAHRTLAKRLGNRASGLNVEQRARIRRLLGLQSNTVAGAAAAGAGRVCRRNPAMCAATAGAVAVGTYLGINYAETTEDVRECMAYCLPDNWGQYKEDVTTVLQYQTTASIQAAYTGDNFPTDLFQEQPYCTVNHVTESDDACEIHCRDRCEEINQSVLGQVGETLGEVGDVLTGILGGTLDFLNDPLGALQTICLWIVGFIVGIILIKFIFGLIIKQIFGKKSRNTQAFSAQPIANSPTNSGPTV